MSLGSTCTHCWGLSWYSKKVFIAQLCPTPWAVAHQAPLATGFSRQEYWRGVAFPFSRESSQPRDRTQVSRIAGRRFTVWATGNLTCLLIERCDRNAHSEHGSCHHCGYNWYYQASTGAMVGMCEPMKEEETHLVLKEFTILLGTHRLTKI